MVSSIDLATYPTARNDANEIRYRQMQRKRFSNGVWIDNGIYGLGSGFKVTAFGSNGMTVRVTPGEGVADGIDFSIASESVLDIGASAANLSRIDLIVVRMDTASPATARLRVIPGNPSSSPERPASVAQTDVVLAQVSIPPGTTNLSEVHIRDTREAVRVKNQLTHLPVLINDWSAFASPVDPPRAIRDGAGVVHLEGRVTRSQATNTLPIFVLPDFMRPQYAKYVATFSGPGGTTLGVILVQPTGEVLQVVGHPAAVSLGSVSFPSYQ